MSGTDAEDEDPAKTQADVTAVALALDCLLYTSVLVVLRCMALPSPF